MGMETNMRGIIVALSIWLMAAGAFAKPVGYGVDQAGSRLGFVYLLGDDEITGRFPVFDADLMIDFESVSQSSISVTIDATQANAGLVFAQEPMLGATVLNVARYPQITFRSSKVELGAHPTIIVTGDLTIRDVTRPISLTARLLFDPSQLELREEFVVELEGNFSRSAFGASGHADLVGDQMQLKANIAVVRK